LAELQERLQSTPGENERLIFEAHLMVLEDRALLVRVAEALSNRRQNAQLAFYAVLQNVPEAMRRLPVPYLRERTAALRGVCQGVQRNFRDDESEKHPAENEKHILVAYELSPSDTAAMDRRHVLGFATELGSVNSHTAILARSLGLPAIVGLEDA